MALLSQDPSVSTTYVHTEGAVSLAYSPDARFLYSGGADGIRCFDLTQAVDAARTIEYHKDPVTFLDCSVDFLASCSESGETVLHEHAASSDQTPPFKSLITRTSLPTRSIKFSPNQRKLAVASDELYIKIVDVQDPLNSSLLTGHTKSIKSLSWSPDSTLLVSSGCEGVLRIWNLSKQSPSGELPCSQEIENILPTVLPESHQSIEAVWHPSGKYFVAPSRESGLAIFAKSSSDQTWKRSRTVCQPDQSKQTKPITSLRFSLNGKYLATGCQYGMIVIWETQTWTPQTNIQPESDCSITAIQWRPQANSIVAANQLGQVINWHDVIPSTQPPPFNPPSLLDPTHNEQEDEIDLLGEEDVEPFNAAGYENEDWVIDDLDTGRNSNKTNTANQKSSTYQFPSRTHHLSSHLSTVHSQETFQPGATTLKHRSLETKTARRYLAFNLLGLVHVLEKEDENIVTVEFHDKGRHNGYHFTDQYQFNLGSIGNLGLAFACSASRSNPSVIRYTPFESWTTGGFVFRGSEKIGPDEEASWQFELPPGESATCIACGGCANEDGKIDRDGLAGSGTVAVGTTLGYLRLFTGSGIQTYVWNLGQQIISLACSHEFIFVVHRPSILSQSHPLSYTLMDSSSFEIVQEGIIPLPNIGVVLSWIGFSHPHSIPACYDSNGVLSFLDKARRPRQGRWVPMLATASLKTQGQLDRVYWPVGVSDSELSCIILKGGETQPSIPAPVIQDVHLQMPLLEQDSPQGQLEESYLRGSLIHHHRADLANPENATLRSELSINQLELEKQVLKLIESCCKTEPEPSLQKALDYSTYLKNMNTLDASMKISKFFNLAGLQERISKLQEARELEDELADPSGLGKRKSKYAHLEDYEIMTDSRSSSKRKAGSSALSVFQQPFEELPSAMSSARAGGRLFNQADVFKAPAPSRRADQVAAQEDEDDEDEERGRELRDPLELSSTLEVSTDALMHDPDDDLASLNSSVKRPKLSEYSLNSQSQSTVRESTNPFAKKKPVPTKGSTMTNVGGNLFGTKAVGRTPPTPELKKSGKFFDRVDERHGLNASASKKKDAKKRSVKQATLLDFATKKSASVDVASSAPDRQQDDHQ
ncbi:uncharacterized protein PGTG_11440 [Puccinia graminis f. sp. tritici CRL 75-36-700-3]|uniref:Uncharacterized protein n=1 Tax=Puccinia graminis f. sp. tritici (strain CRL 75-36-700-3 / race SCCL) TaxID=418459 RepID=E3KLS2_PUCGT|nr:uncharacterized protein PGTG_11440 [Puccinia graminis f. sp. tritici CRL 75-36-700-3]EFP85271.2 hypothetical protein PGTG_11440 [Puccinia graminis f. sp. tritici CRL 75-36-700-3]